MPLVQVVGFGPAALGVPLAADRAGRLDELGALGVRFLDRAGGPSDLRRQRFPYVVESNSRARDFLAAVDPDGRFGGALAGHAGTLLAGMRDQHVPLRLVGEFLGDLAAEVVSWLGEGAGEVRYGCEVDSVRRDADGTFWTSSGGRPVGRSRTVLLATGAREDDAPLGVPAERVASAGDVLAGRLDRVERALGAGMPVAIVGGSHSGFSAASLLLERYGDGIGPGQVTVVYRSLSLAFETVTEMTALGDLPLLSPPVVCPETGMVNRFRGLRGQARGLCTAVLRGTERRVALCRAGTGEARRALRGAGLVLRATGYRHTRVPDLLDGDGRPLRPVRHGGCVAVDDRCRILGADGPVHGLYGLGLGFARRDATGEARVGLNVFHGSDSAAIVDNLLELAAKH